MQREKQWKRLNETLVAYPEDRNILDYFREQVEKTPDQPALYFEEEVMTYKELDERTDRVSAYLGTQKVGSGSIVGLFMDRSLEMVIAILGTVKSGAAYCPLDPGYPMNRIQYMLDDTGTKILLTQEKYRDLFHGQKVQPLCLDSQWSLIEKESGSPGEALIQQKDIAYVIYTSGSTGNPKGVMNTHGGLLNRILWMQDYFNIHGEDKVLQKTPYSFDVSVWEFFWPLMTGAGLVIAKPEGHKDPKYLADVIIQHNVSIIHFVPSMLQVFLTEKNINEIKSLKKVICSGEALPLVLVNRFYDVCTAELYNLYGPTEAAIDVTCWKCVPGGIHGVVPIGKPIANTQIYILDEKGGMVNTGEAGELHIGGKGLAQGYLNMPELTAQKFIQHPFGGSQEERLYKTGDLARILEDGNIEYIGRIDFQVKLRGFRIELNEIEKVLDHYRGIRQSVVVLREDVPGNKQLAAYYLSEKGDELPKQNIMEYLSQYLPEYMIPFYYTKMQAFPLSNNGKIDRKSLPVPKMNTLDKEGSFVPPGTDIEKDLVEIWSKALNYDKISVQDDFLSLGGHSLVAVQILSEVNDLYQISISLGQFLTNGRTVRSLGGLVEESLIQSIDPDEMKLLMEEMDGLSEEEILQMLGQVEE